MLRIDPDKTAHRDFHQYLLGAVAPRPIAFVSTLGADGVSNLAPYSFFNVFSSNPPILVFSSSRRATNATVKDTLMNVQANGELVVNVVTYPIVRQMTIASLDYPSAVSEFDKAGFTPLASELVKPFRVAESPVHMECRVQQIIPLGEGGGAGNLIICRVVLMHVDEKVLNDTGRIDPHKIDLMARMGRMYYARASGAAVMEIVQETTPLGVGFDGLPTGIRHSPILTGNELAAIAALPELPVPEVAEALVREHLQALALSTLPNARFALHQYAKTLLSAGKTTIAAAILVFSEKFS
jgi:flavin reductase (DIM6/NTAB) family NADH-FMN oxidoreductase RutF